MIEDDNHIRQLYGQLLSALGVPTQKEALFRIARLSERSAVLGQIEAALGVSKHWQVMDAWREREKE